MNDAIGKTFGERERSTGVFSSRVGYLRPMSPRDTFNQYVLPALKDLEQDPAALHRAVSTLSFIDALAEDVWNERRPTQEVGSFRDSLAAQFVELAYARDDHDIHKHGEARA